MAECFAKHGTRFDEKGGESVKGRTQPSPSGTLSPHFSNVIHIIRTVIHIIRTLIIRTCAKIFQYSRYSFYQTPPRFRATPPRFRATPTSKQPFNKDNRLVPTT